jgi:hypothetical protein
MLLFCAYFFFFFFQFEGTIEVIKKLHTILNYWKVVGEVFS